MLCPHCNQEISENAMFCSNCGTQIKKEEVQNNNFPTIEENKQQVGFDGKNMFNENMQSQQPFMQNNDYVNNQNTKSINSSTATNFQTQQNPYSMNNMQQNIPTSNPYQFQPNSQVEGKKDKKTILIIVGIVAALLLVCCCCLPGLGILFL